MPRLVLGGILAAALLAAPVASAQSRSQQGTATPVAEKHPAGKSATAIKDTWITTKTKSKLFADGRVKGRKISVETHSGVVTLRGKVHSVEEKSAAEHIARGVDGVKWVNSVLQVVPDAERKFIDAKDDDIKDAVKARFEKDGTWAADVKVRSDNGLVTLTGTVPNQRAKVRAAELARTAPGVKAVRNELRQKG